MAPRTRVWMICLCALLASCQAGLHSSTGLDYPNALERAERLIEQESFDDAEALLGDLVGQFPQRAMPWILLGGSHDLQQDPEQAHRVYQQGLKAVDVTHSGYADLALQASLLCINHPSLSCDPVQPLSRLPENDSRRDLVTAAQEARQGKLVDALRRLIALLDQQLPQPVIGEVYFLAASIYRHMNEPMYVNESLFHAVNFAKNPILVLRIEKLWKPSN